MLYEDLAELVGRIEAYADVLPAEEAIRRIKKAIKANRRTRTMPRQHSI